ncbi:MAG: hypothetical protein ACFE0Q_20415 [Anaerolineae bacterium]
MKGRLHMATEQEINTHPILHHGDCPSCRANTSFDLVGVQTWPEHVAQQLDMDPVQTVWRCRHCQTTLMAPALSMR